MRFKLGAIPESDSFFPDATWKSLREPGPWLMQLLALPIGLVSFVLVCILWAIVKRITIVLTPNDLIIGLVLFIPIIVVHELIHAAVHPGFGMSRDSIIGCWPSRGLFYAHYEDELTRNRFLAILMMPTIIITFVPLAFAFLTSRTHIAIMWASSWNMFFACGDMFAILLVFYQVPRHATCRNKGYRTFWKQT